MPQGFDTNIPKVTSLICLGSNATSWVGGPADTLRAALQRLGDGPVEIRAQSRFYVSPFVPAGQEPDVVNAVVEVETLLSADALLAFLHDIEASLGRERKSRWTSRTIDLDLLTMNEKIAPDQSTLREWVELETASQRKIAPSELILPHPRMQDRAFVLVPAAEIAPNWRHPLLGKTIREMLDDLPDEDVGLIRPLQE